MTRAWLAVVFALWIALTVAANLTLAWMSSGQDEQVPIEALEDGLT